MSKRDVFSLIYHNVIMNAIITMVVIIRNRHVWHNVPLSTVFGHMGVGVVINQRVSMGRDCMIAQNVTIAKLVPDGDVPVLGDGVICLANSVILGGIGIGHHSVIAAGAVVVDSCEPYSLMMGNPARFVRFVGLDEYRTLQKIFRL